MTTVTTQTARGYFAGERNVPASFWTSLRYYNVSRIVVAALFLVGALVRVDLFEYSFGSTVFAVASGLYLAAALGFQSVLSRWREHFDVHLTLHVVTDILAVTLLMSLAGGFHSGLAVLLLITLAGAALVSRGLMTYFYAALATIALLLEQSFQVLFNDASAANFLQPGLLGVGYFATASITNRLARRVVLNERVARQRAVELANQMRINELVIRDMQDGVLVVDGDGLVRHYNRRVEELIGKPVAAFNRIEDYSPELATGLAAWRATRTPELAVLTMPASGRRVRARFVNAGVEDAATALVFVEDLSRIEEEARQVKLVALGRLTANIAHEIRNPLSAITHAADLAREESATPELARLMRIIRDNSRRLNRMVGDVLELNRRDRLQLESIRLADFLAGFIDGVIHGENIPSTAIAIACDAGTTIDFDRVHLNQVLWNLVRNAWRHSRRQSGSVRVATERHGNRLELHIIDDGGGVPSELRGQLFEPFFTTSSAGTGLGLYIARELCAANGAALDYVDRGAGADFRIHWQGREA